MNSRKVVVVTGFGPFSRFSENPSSKIVELLGKSNAPFGEDITLVTELLPVAYGRVAERVPQLWQDNNPLLVVHIGVHPTNNRTIYLEQQSFNRGYTQRDVKGEFPTNHVCCKNNKCSISISGLDCKKISKEASGRLNSNHLKLAVSHNPGRYLCAFSYFISLNQDKNRSLFVHIPPPDKHATIELQTDALKLIIIECLNRLNKPSRDKLNKPDVNKCVVS